MSRRRMSTQGAIVAAILVVLGLAVVGYFVLVAIALNSYGSNK